MPKDLKDHAVAFSGGFALPVASVIDCVTGKKMGLEQKTKAFMYAAKSTPSVDVTGVAGMFLGVVTSGTAVSTAALALVMGGYTLVTKSAEPNVIPPDHHTQVAGNADAGKEKIQQAASAAGIIVPKLHGGPQ